MSLESVQICKCVHGLLVCAKCGGFVQRRNTNFDGLDPTISSWITELECEHRLNSTLATYMAIDTQYRHGAPIGTAVSYAIKEIGANVGEMRTELESQLIAKFNEIKNQNEMSARQLIESVKDVVGQQTEAVICQVKILLEQGKSVAEIQGMLKETVGSVQTYLTAIGLPTVKGEEGEINVLRDLQDAFLGQSSLRIEPVGGADATDVIVKFCKDDIEIGRSLVEVKSRKTWSSEYMEQVREDMRRYNVALAALVVDKLPKTAKARGFHVDTEMGVVIITPPELIIPTVTMFYEIHAAIYRLQKRTLDLQSVVADRDLVYYINDNMKTLDDCKRISDVIDDSSRKVKEHVTNISSRLQNNNAKIAEILTKFSMDRTKSA